MRLNVGSQRTLNEAQPAKNVKDGGNVPTTMAFASMGLSKQSMRAITEVCKFTHATAVQDQTLPHITKGVDVLARAKTGSGKTVGFTLPSIELLMKNPETRKGDVSVLIVSPTRIGESNSRGSEPVVDLSRVRCAGGVRRDEHRDR